MQKRRSKVTINQKDYIVIGTKPEDHVNTAAKLVDTQLQLLKKSSPQLSIEDCSILLALNTISKQIELEKEIIQLRNKNRQTEKSTKIIGNTENNEDHSPAVEQPNLFDTFEKNYVPAIHDNPSSSLFK